MIDDEYLCLYDLLNGLSCYPDACGRSLCLVIDCGRLGQYVPLIMNGLSCHRNDLNMASVSVLLNNYE